MTIQQQADAIVHDYTAEDELRPHKSLYGIMTIFLTWRTGLDLDKARLEIEAAAERMEASRDKDWLTSPPVS